MGLGRRVRGERDGRWPDAYERRASGPAPASEPHVVPRDRLASARVDQYRQDTGAVRLPQARRLVPLGSRDARSPRGPHRWLTRHGPTCAEHMNTFTVWRFATPEAADEALPGLIALAELDQERLADAAL